MPHGSADWLQGKRALVMGIGTRQGGLGVTRYLVSAGADVTVTDLRDQDALSETLSDLQGLPIRYRLGEHVADDFVNADVVVRNPGVPVESPWLTLAREHGASIEMEMTLFFRACPAPIIGITGTKGKTTTSTLVCRDPLPPSRRCSPGGKHGSLGARGVCRISRGHAGRDRALELATRGTGRARA